MSKKTLFKMNYIKHSKDIFNISLKYINIDVLDVNKKFSFAGLNDDEQGIFLEFHSYENDEVRRDSRDEYKIYFELYEVDTSFRKNKKLYAKFKFFGPARNDVNILNEPYYKTIHFGDDRYQDYTIHQDLNRKNLYHKRAVVHHQDPLNAGTLSLYILWSHKTIEEGIEFYKTSYKL